MKNNMPANSTKGMDRKRHMKILRKRDLPMALFAIVCGIGVAGHILLHDLDHHEPFVSAITKSVIILVVCAMFILVAYISGGRRLTKGEIQVSPWFAVFVVGSLFSFMVGGIFTNNFYYGGIAMVAIWCIALASIWATARYIIRRKSGQLSERNEGHRHRT